jgi:hypothetical protein
MKHHLRLFSIALAICCVAGTARAFVPSAPPASGPGSVFHGNEDAAPLRDPALKQKSIPKRKIKKPRSEVKQSQPK